MTEFYPLLNAYSKGKISIVNFDMDFDTISVAVKNKNKSQEAEIIFEDVHAFYYIDHDAHKDLEISNETLNTISYDTVGFGEFTAHTDDDSFVSIPNFALSINNESSLYIDAHKIRINNQSFKVKY